MEEATAHKLYSLFQQVDKGAKQKQGLGFSGAGAGFREYAGDDDDVIARNKRLRGRVYGTEAHADNTGSDEYDSDTATAVLRRLKQLKKSRSKDAADNSQASATFGIEWRAERDRIRVLSTKSRSLGPGGVSSAGRGSPDYTDAGHVGRERLACRGSPDYADAGHAGMSFTSLQRCRAEKDSPNRMTAHDTAKRRSQDTRRRDGSPRHWEDEFSGSSARASKHSRGFRDRCDERSTGRERAPRQSRGRDSDHERGREDDRGWDRRRVRDREYERRRGREHKQEEDSGRGAKGKQARKGEMCGSKRTSARTKLDFEALVPGYAGMTGAQKLKARTQLLLERSSQADQQRNAQLRQGGQEQWTRFAFDQNAYLDEEGGRPGVPGVDAEEGGSVGGAGLSRLNAVTFKQSVREAQQQGRDVLHEDAIFGRPPTLDQSARASGAAASKAHASGAGGMPGCGMLGSGEGNAELSGFKVEGVDSKDDGPAIVDVHERVTEVVVAMEGEGRQGARGPADWRERAAALRARRAQQA